MKPLGCLWPLSIPYQAAINTRNRLYDIGILKSLKVNAPVISVGNLSVGGTGKTPFVIHLLERLKELKGKRKLRSGVVSRGYKAGTGGTMLVSDGRRQFEDVRIAGDEPVLISESVSGVVVVVDRNRHRGAEFAVREQRVNLVVLDDGFQHRRLYRDLDIVLLDAADPLGNRRVLPAGYLREPVSGLQRADLIILSKAKGTDDELAERALKLQNLLKKPVAVTRLAPVFWRRINQTEILAPEEIAGKKTIAFAGIARPESFFDTVRTLGADLIRCIPLPDHCNYSKRYLDYVSGQFVRNKAEWLVTTTKDALKLPPILRFLPLYYLDFKLEAVSGEEILDEMLLPLLDGIGNGR